MLCAPFDLLGLGVVAARDARAGLGRALLHALRGRVPHAADARSVLGVHHTVKRAQVDCAVQLLHLRVAGLGRLVLALLRLQLLHRRRRYAARL